MRIELPSWAFGNSGTRFKVFGLIADASGLKVVAGPVESAAWGNVLVQARALGLAEAASPEAGRQLVRRSVRMRTYVPTHGQAVWDRAIGIVLAGRGC